MSAENALFTPVKSKRTFETVSSRIKESIFQGVLKPGDRLPSETELASQFSVGRQTVREALRILELSGFIAVQKGGGGGAVVQNSIVHALNALFLDAVQLEKITIEEMTQARLDVEKIVVQYVIKNADEADFAALGHNIEQAKEKLSQKLLATEENLEFHRILAKASKNQVLVIVAECILAVFAELLKRLGPDFRMSQSVVSDHEIICEALTARSEKKAMRLLEQHLKAVQKRLKNLE